MSSPEEIVKDLLVAGSIGTFGSASGWGIFIGDMPDKPDQAISISPTGGAANPKFRFDEPRIQILVRSKADDYSGARTKIQAIKDLLIGNPSTDGAEFRGAWVTSDVLNLGKDQIRRPELSINFRLLIAPSTGTHRTAI